MWFCHPHQGLARHMSFLVRSLVVLSLWFGFLLACVSPTEAQTVERSSPPTSLGDPQELETFLNGVMTRQLADNHIPGATISIIKDGRILLDKGYGYADIQQGQKVQADRTVFRLGSVSKLFTWTAIMQLVEEGKVDLHADVNVYLKTFRIPATYPQPITIENLLTHTAGFEDGTIGQLVPQIQDLEPLGAWLPKHIPARIFSPGVVTAYSDYGAALAGYIVEQVSGMSFERYIEQHLFQPLGMRQSTFRQPLPDALSGQLSHGYTYSNGAYHTGSFEDIETVPAGALSSTATDMAHFMIAQLQLGGFGHTRILQESTARGMQQQHFTNDSRLPGMTYGFYEQQIDGHHLIGHSGDTTLFYSLLMLLPAPHVGLFVAFNSHGGSMASQNLLQAFMDHYYPAPQTTSTTPPAGFSERARQIEGTYWSTRRNETSYQKVGYDLLSPVTVSASGSGHLVIKGVGSQDINLVEVQPWIFQRTDGFSDTVIFQSSGTEMNMFIGNRPYQAYQKRVWAETPAFHVGLLLLCLVLFLGVDLSALAYLLRAIRRKARLKPKVGAFRSELPRWLGWTVSTLNVIVLIGLFLLFSSNDPYAVQFAMSPALVVVMMLASVSALLTLGVVFYSFLVWRMPSWNRWQRLFFVFQALAGVVFSMDLTFWHLLWLP
ncbi:FmtA-like protein [Ktedonobacter sp. SOSP1-52]|uniref:serine hydrolase domain-containing protein n=1 Tax=Ktedonobacter sp. SOSP1-52 TaxID=2778366 RepID=UPI0019165C86|nr:serine hydrolase domain-containing protein [Ktedonobacter sp. SOSP1-52]GHO68266.1 FmtA-like protein [Ktedonobacter sp. SOSP1-52]